MKNRYYLSLDAGTGSIRAVLFDGQGTVAAQAGREWTHHSLSQYPGSMEFACDRNWTLAVECIREVLSSVNSTEVAAVSSTTMREGIVLYDRAGQELWACANVDARSVDQVRALRSKSSDFERNVYNESGQTLALGAAPRLLWLKDNQPDVYDRVHAVCMLSDWITIRLGAPLVVDPSNGGTTGLFSLKTRTWSSDIIEACGLRHDMFHAAVFESGTKIGEVSSEAGQQTGIPTGTPIVMGGGDAQVGSVGVGAVHPGDVAIFGGTFWQQVMSVDAPVSDISGRLRLNFHAVPDMWQIETITFFAGMAARWFRDALCPDIVMQGRREGVDPYAILENMANMVPAGSYGIIPIFSDAMNYSKWRHAAPSFLNLGLDPERCNRGAMFRALQENAAHVTRANLERITETVGTMPSQVLFAGGAAKGKLWPQIVADVLQLPVVVPKVAEATALGAAMCAAVGVGDYRDVSEAVNALVTNNEPIMPQRENKAVYDDGYARWAKAYPVQLQLADERVTSHMWQAPGE